MAIPRNARPLHPLLLLLLLLIYVPFSSAAAARFSPADNHLIACGSSSTVVLEDRRLFLPDSGCRSVRLRSPGPKIALSSAPGSPPGPSPLHTTARVFPCASSYHLRIKEKGAHLLRLHFYPFSSPDYDLSSALFHVSASGLTLLTNFSTSAPVLKEFIIWVGSEELVVSFAPVQSSSFAFVNAIEVVSAPADLIGDIATLVKPDQVERFTGLSRQAFETLYRINIGGLKVTSLNDTLWRTWAPDAGDLVKMGSSASKIVSFSGRIAYRKYGASREVAPDSVYSTARVLEGSDGSDSSNNMTWAFPVSSGYRYLVRMHFCDIASLALNMLSFDIYVNGYVGYKDFDLSDAAGMNLASPYYIDFIVDANNPGILTVAIGPSKLSRSSWVHGLLNGLEIMKMNKSIGSFDGEDPVVLVAENPVQRGFGEFIRSVLCGLAFASLFVIIFMLILRLRAELRNTVTWSPLPTDVSEVKLAEGYPVAPSKWSF